MKYITSAGHLKSTSLIGTGVCELCKKTVEYFSYESIEENHTFANGKCACGYKKATAAKTDDRVRSATELINEIKQLVKDGYTVTITNEASAYTETFCFYKDGSKWFFNTVEKA